MEPKHLQYWVVLVIIETKHDIIAIIIIIN